MTSNVLHNVGCQAIIGFWTSYLTRDEPPRISLMLVVMNYVRVRSSPPPMSLAKDWSNEVDK